MKDLKIYFYLFYVFALLAQAVVFQVELNYRWNHGQRCDVSVTYTYIYTYMYIYIYICAEIFNMDKNI